MSKKRKSDENDIIVSCLGTSQEEVTGSCWSISYPKNDNTRGLIVLECGLSQSGGSIEKQYATNKKMIDDIGKEVVQSCEYVLLGHSHVRWIISGIYLYLIMTMGLMVKYLVQMQL